MSLTETTTHVDRCWRCGRQIFEPLSVFVGMGPVCRKNSGIVEARGWQALENVKWYNESRYDLYDRMAEEIEQDLRWWRMRLTMLVPGSEALFDVALNAAEGLRQTSPANGTLVMGCLWRIVGQIRFVLEPTLKTLRDAGIVNSTYVEAVPGLSRIMRNVESVLCGLGAREDAVELAEVRRQDRVTLMTNAPVEPAEGVE